MSSGQAIREGREEAIKREQMKHQSYELKASRELARLTFSFFPEALENYFL